MVKVPAYPKVLGLAMRRVLIDLDLTSSTKFLFHETSNLRKIAEWFKSRGFARDDLNSEVNVLKRQST